MLDKIKKYRREIGISIISIFACFTYFYISKIMNLPYFRASFIKVVMFCVIPTVFLYMVKQKNIVKDLFKIKSIKDIKIGVALVVVLMLLFITSMFLVVNVDFFTAIAKQAALTIDMSLNEYISTTMYIAVVNALVEEYFFRGIVYLNLKKKNQKYAMIFSALLFSLYHAAIFEIGMQVYLYFIGYVILFITGLAFNYIDDKSGTIYNSWIVHFAANTSINLLGLYILLNLK